MASQVPCISLLILALCLYPSWALASRDLLASSSAPLGDGASCRLSEDRKWKPPFCKGGVLNCLIKKLPGAGESLLTGTCNSTAHYCTVGPYRFAVGVKRIPAYGPSSCETCSCRFNPKAKTTNKARCECDPLPPCYIDDSGKTLGTGCPYAIQSQCVIDKVGGGKVVNGVRTHRGRCQAPQQRACVSAGRTWGPLFYAGGTSQVPQPGNRCMACRCRKDGQILACRKIKGCTKP